MEKREEFQDNRVKRKLFPVSMFLVTFVVFGLFTTVQMHIIGNAIDYQSIPLHSQIAIFVIWLLAAVVFTLWTRYQITRHYQKPVEEFSEAARRVASGDFSVYLSPHHTADKSTHLDVLFTDFNKMVEELGSIETLKTDFFSNVSHEIKTPLAVIQNNAELLQLPNLTEERRQEYTKNILHATKRLSNLIMNMLKLNKLEKQAIKPVPKRYDLCAQLCDCALQFEDVWEKKGLEFEVDMEERRTIEADQGLMELVWTNLLSNAVKFTPAGGTVTLIERCEETGITVTVSDTGCGMSDEVKRHIFDKFYQGDTSHSTEGNGLGLALVKRILELSDGHIFVESQAGKGSAFTVRLQKPQERDEDSFKPELEE
ncbi:MAG: HAMP domain-containing sensor histidine kinase [bacterium]|nr:HAMP domain-containing sensor histidine kinase [bacterium]